MTPPPSQRLVELAVHDLGIIESLSLVFGPGMTALTGETGAGKTMIVSAIDLLLGGRADPSLVRAGAAEAVVQGRFEDADGEEVILERIVPADGRSRAYLNGRMVTAAALGEHTSGLVDLHGQHAHQLLLTTATQRAALDRHGRIDLDPLREASERRRAIEAELETVGGDPGSRELEADLLRFQLEELDDAALQDPDEDDRLDAEEDVLADATEHRRAASETVGILTSDGGVLDGIGRSIAALGGRAPFEDLTSRLLDAQAELSDIASEVRSTGETVPDDPARLDEIRRRRQHLAHLRRKYGTAAGADGRAGGGTLADVIRHRESLRGRLEALENHDAEAARLHAALDEAITAESIAAAKVGAARRAAAGPLAEAVHRHLGSLAMPDARFGIDVSDEDPGDDVTFVLAANPGLEAAPLARVASGGELARTMLALRLVLSADPSVLIFDEVDAGIGGSAARAVGRALAELGERHQVLVVTHLPQVAACADQQIRIRKHSSDGSTRMQADRLDHDERVLEIARMLSGDPDGDKVRLAAEELLAERGGGR